MMPPRKPGVEPVDLADVHIDISGIPLLGLPELADAQSLRDWLGERLVNVRAFLARHGALVIRGAEITDVDRLSVLGELFDSMPQGYAGGAVPRRQLSATVYDATSLPPQYELGLHQEMAYLPAFPHLVSFAAFEVADAGGSTTLLSVDGFLAALPEAKVAALRERGLCYRRNLAPPGQRPLSFYHRPWPDVLQCTEPEAAESRCAMLGLEWKWETNGSLSVWHRRPAFEFHALLGRDTWFNQLLVQHPNSHSLGRLRTAVERCRQSGGHYPTDVAFSDGEAIDENFLADFYEAEGRLKLSHHWQLGDFMLLDNLTCAHGRTPFAGNRRLGVLLSRWKNVTGDS